MTLDEMQKLCDEATGGEWEYYEDVTRDEYFLIGPKTLCELCTSRETQFSGPSDAKFIAASREFVPWAIAEIRRVKLLTMEEEIEK